MIQQIIPLLFIAFAVIVIVMTIVWIIQYKTHNAGIVDIIWAFSFLMYYTVYILFSEVNTLRNNILFFMVALWCIRLGSYLFFRNWNKPEDMRYTTLRKEWGSKANMKMFFFFQFQAVLALLLSIPFLLTSINKEQGLSGFEIAGIALWVIGFAGEAIADHQLKTYKQNPMNNGRLCDKGLWYYSRHPNYFFEWLIWVSYFIYALASPYGWMSIICPVLMYHFLNNVTGIKYTEEHMLATRGEIFAEYQRSTSAFFTWFKK